MRWIGLMGWTLALAAGCNDRGALDGDGSGSGGSGDPTGPTDTEMADGTGDTGESTAPEPACELDDSWLVLPPMSLPRSTTRAIRLDDGRVLVPGGVVLRDPGSFETTPVTAVDRFDPTTDTWTTLPDLPSPRSGHGLLRLSDGDVLVVGGWTGDASIAVPDVERFDVETDTWQPAPPLPEALSNVLAASNGELRVVLGRSDDGPRGYAWEGDAWQPISVPANVSAAMDLLPFGSGLALAGVGLRRAALYDPVADLWSQSPTEVLSHPRWETQMGDYVQGAAPLGPDELFVLATTGGLHPEIGQQGVAARLSVGATQWQGGAPGPFLGDTGNALARDFAPGWVLIAGTERGDVYDASSDAWCVTTDAPSHALGATVVLEDGSVLFAGGPFAPDVPLRWTPW